MFIGWTQFNWKGWWFSIQSATFIAIAGVLMITFSSIAGLGLSSMMGVHFNAATTQVILQLDSSIKYCFIVDCSLLDPWSWDR